VQREDKLLFTFEYSTGLFEKATVERFAGYYKKLAAAVLDDSKKDIEISELEIISAEEKRRILFDFNDTRTNYPRDRSIHRLFEEEAERHAEKLSLVYDGQALSYRALDTYSGKWVSYLRQKGVKPGEPVGIMLDTSLEMIAALLGTLKAGAAYLPIDPRYPRERVDFMLKDSGARILITGHQVNLRLLSSSLNSTVNRVPPAASHIAYVMYTSGSTGRPKGVIVEHRNVVRLVKNTHFIHLECDDRVLQTGALEFDASTFEIWVSLLNGLTLYLTCKENILKPGKLKKKISANQITTMWLTSPLFNQLLRDDVSIFRGLRNLLVGGDVLFPVHIAKTRKRYPGLNIINGYGPTENTTFSTTFLIDREYTGSIPIGKPISNSGAYIVDNSGNLQPVGIAGELWVDGDGVARGYLNNPELTFDKFKIKNYRLTTPLAPIAHRPSPIYKTGDLARWLPDGNIDFLGRIDDQVKIRGFRIEPREVERRLLNHPHVNEVFVMAKKTAAGEKYLCA
ncbi:MAG: amino acid adenylation domain-containing protein, partial [bacterium]|nr:amino acid adenylation domain-containing protein [bacterium]